MTSRVERELNGVFQGEDFAAEWSNHYVGEFNDNAILLAKYLTGQTKFSDEPLCNMGPLGVVAYFQEFLWEIRQRQRWWSNQFVLLHGDD